MHASPDALPPKPAAPEPGDCCGGGCALCVLDRYQQELEAWEQRCAEIRRAAAVAGSPERA